MLDMAKSTVPRGKLEVYDRLAKVIPLSWATGERGMATDTANKLPVNLKNRARGGLLTLGGEGALLNGHKGSGLALWVDVFCAVLSRAA